MEEIDDSALLTHWGTYDPAKAHEYYMRTRHLKGRHPAHIPPQPSKHASPVKHVPAKHKPHHKLSPAQKRKQRKEVEAQVKHLTARLDHLDKVLQGLLKKAQARQKLNTSRGKVTSEIQKIANGESPQTVLAKRTSTPKLSVSQKNDAAMVKVEKQVQAIRDELKASLEKAQKQLANELGYPLNNVNTKAKVQKPESGAASKKATANNPNDKTAKNKSKTDASSGRRH
jgi:hypothetical protein